MSAVANFIGGGIIVVMVVVAIFLMFRLGSASDAVDAIFDWLASDED